MKKMKLFIVALMSFATITASAQFVNSSKSSSSSRTPYTTDLTGWNRLSVSFSPMKFVPDDDDLDAASLTGFSVSYEKGISISNRLPLFVETGVGVQYAFKTFDSDDDFGIDDTHTYGISMQSTYSTLNLKVPVNLAYKFTFGNVSLIPYAGINLKLNLLGKNKLSVEDPDDLEIMGYDSEDEFWEDLEESAEDYDIELKQSMNMFDKDDVGGEKNTWKRFQMGWQIGVGLDYNKLHVGLGYTKDFMELSKKLKTSSVLVSLGYNF